MLASPTTPPHARHMLAATQDIEPLSSVIADEPTWDIVWMLRCALPCLALEHMLIAGFDAHFRLMFLEPLGHGGRRAVAIESRRLLALLATPDLAGIMLAHNHPGGDPRPSREDIALTGRIAAVAAFADIRLIDHIVLTADDHASFRALSLL